ncbi:Fur family transcriptional regulator [Uliginosibacterium sp. H1]|uniref:Fur family transcriptional regulator n=1 Tax=Uliginosibacterium sp. H1 TaxID=3114757 RepID=UPI002E185981|nr:transcriptional repressor [Uliginosibacterium sp. H1]
MDPIQDLFKEKGLKPTVNRIAVFTAMLTVPDGRSAVEPLFQALSRSGVHISMSMLYVTLRKLSDHGLLGCERDGGPSGERVTYSLPSAACGFPLRVVCRNCRKESHLNDERLKKALYRASEASGLKLTDQPITVSVSCEACAELGRRRRY